MKNSIKLLHWTPRILCILAILFVSLFAFDSFEEGKTIGQQLLAFTIHLIPSFVLILFLSIAWKWEKIGGVLFIVIGAALTPYIYNKNFNMNHNVWLSIGIIAAITIPFIMVGILFVISDLKKRNLSA